MKVLMPCNGKSDCFGKTFDVFRCLKIYLPVEIPDIRIATFAVIQHLECKRFTPHQKLLIGHRAIAIQVIPIERLIQMMREYAEIHSTLPARLQCPVESAQHVIRFIDDGVHCYADVHRICSNRRSFGVTRDKVYLTKTSPC